MIAKISRGANTYGLLRYQYGPGKYEEHNNQHMVGASGDEVRDPARSNGTIKDLAEWLDRPLYGVNRPKHVWHCSVRCAPGDRVLTDEEWGAIAERVVNAAGLGKCRYAAIRHADDHIHIAATLAREKDGSRPNIHNDAWRVRDEMRKIERDYGLTATAPANRTARKRPTRAEKEKAARQGRPETPRETLARKVREAAATAPDEAGFFDRLGKAGLKVRLRRDADGTATGYAVGLPGDRNAGGGQIEFSGCRLAPDLSLPRIRQRWAATGNVVPVTPSPPRRRGTEREIALRSAADTVRQTAKRLATEPDQAFHASAVAALGDLLTVTARQSPKIARGELQAAARAFERAARVPYARGTSHPATVGLWRARLAVSAAGQALGGHNDAGAVFTLTVALLEAVSAARHAHAARRYAAQAEAAAAAGRHLRAAVERLRAVPQARADHQPAQRADLRAAVRTALIGHTDPEKVLADPRWQDLAAVLRQAEAAGHSAAGVLAARAADRELWSAAWPGRALRKRIEEWLDEQRLAGVTHGQAPSRSQPGQWSRAAGREGPGRRDRPPPVPPR